MQIQICVETQTQQQIQIKSLDLQKETNSPNRHLIQHNPIFTNTKANAITDTDTNTNNKEVYKQTYKCKSRDLTKRKLTVGQTPSMRGPHTT